MQVSEVRIELFYPIVQASSTFPVAWIYLAKVIGEDIDTTHVMLEQINGVVCLNDHQLPDGQFVYNAY